MQVVLWHNVLSPHQSAFTRSLVCSGIRTTVVAETGLSAERRAIGWDIPDFGSAEIILHPSESQVRAIVSDRASTIHVLAGARWRPLGARATHHCIRSGRQMGIMSECADFRSLPGLGRWIKYSLERFSTGRHFDFVLGIGQTGVRWFRACGYPSSIVFPFAYFVETPEPILSPEKPGKALFTIAFVGRCVEGKGLENLVMALRLCKDLEWKLLVLGDGPLRSTVERDMLSFFPKERFEITGFLPHKQILQRLPLCDLLVLPSNGKEGWGAVINEALMCGVPVVCSARCGASDLIRSPYLGEVFKTGSTQALAGALRHRIAQGRPAPELRSQIRKWSRCIRGSAGADYFLNLLKHVYGNLPRPEAPWRIEYLPP